MIGEKVFRYTTTILFFTHSILAIVGYFWTLPNEIPLWYSLVRPEDQLTPKAFVFLFPGLALFFLMLHHMLSSRLKAHETALQVLWFGTSISLIFLTIAMIRILVLVT